uniref:Pescadillo homolog n=1 Tax=Aceria tosichella TaxID=561515 RepID=A0A6G1SNT5_9ACAR
MKQLSKKKVKERRKKGIVKAYMSRAAAVRRLQVSLSDFRRLCILKGVYPVEPRNKSKLTGANTRRKTYFFTRDIQMLMNEPLLYKFSEFKVFMRRLTRAKGRHDREAFEKQMDNKPFYKLDTVVKERYPRFIDALRDCDDALSMCFLFAMFPKGPGRPDDLIDLSKKLTIEFMHYIINSKSLRKVFISIKGYYYQADIMGQTVTWLVPHQFVIDRVSNVDLNVMKTFTEFYVTVLGFINFKLYKSINAIYPPQVVADNLKELRETKGILDNQLTRKKSKKRKMPDDEQEALAAENRDDLIAALNKHIRILENKSVTKMENADQQPDVFDEEDEDKDNKSAEKKLSVQDVMLLERLFEGMKFFLNRETPRESLTFVIRSFGGEVSWDKNLFPGATFDESDPSITHQIVDRPSLSERRLNRVYIQPQWVYDSINMRMLLPTTEYLIGATLPPHLSPFVNEKRGDYVPPDKIKLINLRKRFEAEKASEARVSKGQAGVESDLETDNELENATAIGQNETEGEDDDADQARNKRKFKPNANADKDDIDSFDSKRSRERLDKNRRKRERDSNKSTSRSKMSVKTGKLKIEDKEELARKEDAEHRKMGIMMIPKKRKRLFDKITRTQKERKQKTEKMRHKRKIVEAVKSRSKRPAK